MEQEIASIIQFVLSHAGNPYPYYWNVPENFMFPAVFFPIPEIETGGETFLTYNLDYLWAITFFDTTEQKAYVLGESVLTALKKARNLIPLLMEDGSTIEGDWVRVNDPSLRLSDGAALLTIRWRSRRPYDGGEEAPQATAFYTHFVSGPTLSDEEADELEAYAVPVN